MKILHITDSHGTVKGPESRKDIYYITFLRKLYELGYVVKKEKIDMVIHTGDLFHTARVSDKFAGQVSEMIKSWQVPVYVVPGNHDIEGYTTDTIDQTKLGLLAKAGVIQLLDRDNPITITANQDGEEYTVAISGQEYYAHIDEGNMQDFEMQQDEADFNILAIHGYIADTAQHPNIKCTMVGDIVTDADVILTGHYHRQFEWNGPDVDIYNPGSMMRVEQTDYNKTHMPQYGILDIHLVPSGAVGYNYTFHEFKIAQPSTTVFDYNSKYKAKVASITLEGFKTSIANTMNQMSTSAVTNIIDIINNICANTNVDAVTQKKVLDVYNDTLQSIPDEFEVQQGFIPAQNQKYITSVTLKNFQAHKDTTVQFDRGLNIIVGESNNGKTSILRGILWAIDNQPLGNDFIMAGENDCSVTINFSDGTYIKRGRTVKNTGYYEIRYIDDNGKYIDQTYRGFTNAVPVEVANVHQMPKVNITKDIETHLNVLSQLDGPFLLTESPLVKASAIGRITGTHVIDAAIKESNKTIQSNRKLVKSYSEDLQQKENERKQLPDIKSMEAFTKKYAYIVKYITKLNDSVIKINADLQQISQYQQQMIQEKERCERLKKVAALLPIIQTAKDKFNKVMFLHGKLTKYQELSLQIEQNQISIERGKYFAKLKPLVDKAVANILNVSRLNDYVDKVNTLTNDISVSKFNKTFMSKYALAVKSIIVHCQVANTYVSKLAPKVDEISDMDLRQIDLCKSVTTTKKNIKSIKANITKIQKERNQFILDQGYCPCCGQKVYEAVHSDAIINFFEEV